MQRKGRVNFDSIGYRLFTGDVNSEGGGLASYVVVRKQIQRNADGYPALDQDGKMVYLDSDGINGRSVLEQKFGIIKEWLKTNFNYDIDKVHKEVQRRQYVVNDDGTYKARCQWRSNQRAHATLFYRSVANGDGRAA